jgi:hypothetical protein
VIRGVIDCSFESSDDATVNTVARPVCQDNIKTLVSAAGTQSSRMMRSLLPAQGPMGRTEVPEVPLNHPDSPESKRAF